MTSLEVQRLKAQGYCRTSNKWGLLSRIDRPDWQQHMAERHCPWSAEQGMKWVRGLGKDAEDQYRRVYSQDSITVPRDVAKQFPPSGGTVTGYKPKEGK
ncbi:hypothetical protein WK13_34480 [Burkholderia ubonensis]|uniref:hypothetical protein n=1 Tax=Burkholderia ubonensis TaxID=101571 RepID=UPI00075D1E56|nr:hypothetical protein [Burkholderia ubonensis]KVR21647.1 hypothetical protein WK13_34480 [Burkholderia ubonensis]